MYNNFSSKKTKKVISALLASALVVTSAPITADAATTKAVGVGKTFKVTKTTKVSGLSKSEKKIVSVSINKKKKTVTVKGKKAGSASFKIGSKSYNVKVVSIKSIKKKSFATTLTAKKNKAVSAVVSATNAKYDTFTWTSSDKKVVTVSKSSAKMDSKTKLVKNTLKPLKKGSATITVKSKATGKKLSVKVNVKAASTTTPAPSASTAPSTAPSVAPSTTPEATASATPVTTPGVSADPSAQPSTAPSAEPTTAPAVKAELSKAFTNGANRVQVDFTNKIQAPKAENFKIEGATVESAELTDDAKSVILTTSTLTSGKEYTLTTTGIVDANNEAVADGTFKFTAEKVAYEVKMEITETELKADGKASTQVKVTLYDEKGNIVKDKAEVKFDTTAGSFAETRVTVQNGVATNTFYSEISTTVKEAYITATVVSAENKDLLNVTTSRTIKLNPNANTDADQTVGASLTDVVVETCDRVILYFNKDVKATDYTAGTVDNKYGYDPDKMTVKILNEAKNDESGIPAGSDERVREPIALAEVPGNTKALYAILSTDKCLTDNAKTVVEVTDKTKSVEVKDTKSTLVSDIRVPSMLAVESVGLKAIKVIFSEPIQSGEYKDDKDANGNPIYSAEILKKWVIDGTSLDDAKWGVKAVSGAAATVGKFDTKTGEDTRNVVTITLGKDSEGNQIYFKAGKHSVQGNKIGDWANLTDPKNNIINTQTLDFEIEASTEAPTATVKEESPEQFALTFNTPVDQSKVEKYLKLQKYESNQWVDVDVKLHVTDVDEKQKEYVVELEDDWTKILDTKNSEENYYNFDFRLHIDKEKIENSLNGLKNAEINLPLADENIMKKPDVTSPKIKDVKQDGKEGVIVYMDKPVQIPNTTKGGEVITKSQTQGEVPNVTVTFISEDNKKTISGSITEMLDAHDNAFKVSPDKELTSGTWKVIVRSISDDVGNTAETLVKEDFKVEGTIETVDTSFNIRWIIAVKANTENPINDLKADEDMVYIKFNKNFKTYDGAANAGSTINYTVNGIAVPTTAKIDTSLKQYNDKANLKNNYTDLVAIHLGTDKLNKTSNTVNISSTIESVTGVKLGNAGMKVLDETSTGVFKWNYKTYNKAVTKAKVSEIQTILNSSEYEEYDLRNVAFDESTAKASLTVSHSGSVKFAADHAFKELNINTKETGTIAVSGGAFNIINVNAPNADVIINDVKVEKKDGVTDSGNVNVIDVLDGTLVLNNVTAEKVVVKDKSNGCAISTEGNTKVNKIVVSVAAPLSLGINSAFVPTVVVEEAAKLDIVSETNVAVPVEVKSDVVKDVEIKTNDKVDINSKVVDANGKEVEGSVSVSTGSSVVVKPENPSAGGSTEEPKDPVDPKPVSQPAIVGISEQSVVSSTAVTGYKEKVEFTVTTKDIADGDKLTFAWDGDKAPTCVSEAAVKAVSNNKATVTIVPKETGFLAGSYKFTVSYGTGEDKVTKSATLEIDNSKAEKDVVAAVEEYAKDIATGEKLTAKAEFKNTAKVTVTSEVLTGTESVTVADNDNDSHSVVGTATKGTAYYKVTFTSDTVSATSYYKVDVKAVNDFTIVGCKKEEAEAIAAINTEIGLYENAVKKAHTTEYKAYNITDSKIAMVATKASITAVESNETNVTDLVTVGANGETLSTKAGKNVESKDNVDYFAVEFSTAGYSVVKYYKVKVAYNAEANNFTVSLPTDSELENLSIKK